MFRKLLLLFSVLLSFKAIHPQDVTAHLMLSDSVKDCTEIQYAAMQLIPLYYQDGITDTAGRILDYWERKCGRDETIYRTRVLWAIDSGTFTKALINNETIGFLDTYQRFANDTSGFSLEEYYYYAEEFELLRWYKSFTDILVDRALQYTDLSAEERFFLLFYDQPADSLYLMIQEPVLDTTRLAEIYTQPVGGTLPASLFHYGFAGGLWKPYDKLSTLGMHPSLGIYGGLRNKRMIYNLGAHFRVFPASNSYEVVFEDSLYSTEEFLGINISLEAGRLFSWRSHELYIAGGPDLEMINALTIENDPDNTEDDESRILTAPSIHFGAGYRFYFGDNRYLGLSSRYNWHNFRNKGGTNLRGNAMSITLEYGFGANKWRSGRKTYLRERIPAN